MDPVVRLKALYRRLPEGRRASPRLEAWAAGLASRLFGRASTAPARALEAKLRAGFTAAAAADLAALAGARGVHPRRAAEAAWALARHHADRGAPEAALAWLARVRALAPRARRREAALLEAECLIRLGRAAEALPRLRPLLRAGDPEALLIAAGAEPDEGARLAHLARAFGPAGGLALADPEGPLVLDNLAGADAPPALPLSVIVPVHRQWDLVLGLLAALAAQTLAHDRFEVLLVNNGEDPPEPAPAAPAGAGFALRLLDCPTPGAYAARNHGAARARGGLLVFTDADCLPAPGWLAALAAAAAAHPGRLIAGPVRMLPVPPAASGRPNPFAAYDGLRGIPQERYVRLGYAATANLAVPRALFFAHGGFDPTRFSGGDAEFCRRAGRGGARILLAPAAAVAHPTRETWEALALKARRVKGGQILGGAPRARAIWLVRTLTPPFRATARFLRMRRVPWAERRAAIGVLYRLWGVELAETARLMAGRPPERR